MPKIDPELTKYNLSEYWIDSIVKNGDSCPLGLSHSKHDRTALAYGIPHASFSTLDDDFLGVSNVTRIVEDFGEHVVTLHGEYGLEVLVVRADADLPEELLSAIYGLCDYPLYDEDDHSQRECDQFNEDVSQEIDWALFDHGIEVSESEYVAISQYLWENCQDYRLSSDDVIEAIEFVLKNAEKE